MNTAESTPIDFEWAVIRVVPLVHREEFVNVGVILHARTSEYLDVRMEPPWHLIEALQPTLDRQTTERHLDAFAKVCRGDDDGGTVALRTPSERFHWLTAPRSAVVQTSAVRPGRSHYPGAELERLFHEQVTRHVGAERG